MAGHSLLIDFVRQQPADDVARHEHVRQVARELKRGRASFRDVRPRAGELAETLAPCLEVFKTEVDPSVARPGLDGLAAEWNRGAVGRRGRDVDARSACEGLVRAQ